MARRPSRTTTTRACQDADPYPGTGTFTSSGGGTWTKVIVSSNSGPGATDERLNFATWYNYYRIRMAMTKSAASLAFTPLTDSFRVGFITMNPKFRDEQPASASNPDLGLNAAVNPQKFLPVKRLQQHPAQPLVQQALLAEGRRHVAGP